MSPPSYTDEEHRFTSTGIKFWRHKAQMESYRAGTGRTVISTHISPEGACNLKCPYCSVSHRNTHSRISLEVIKKYVTDLIGRGLKAVILTGGGEPTIYLHFNELVLWLTAQNLKLGLITNGTVTDRVAPEAWSAFSWVRVSINIFDGWQDRITLPRHLLDPRCVVGCSMVYTANHQAGPGDNLAALRAAAHVATRCGAEYVRLLPDCELPQGQLLESHAALEADLKKLKDDRFFHQHKVHAAPQCGTCHQSYFRPYLSEAPFKDTGKPGTVYPCDSVVLNNGIRHFAEKWQLCAAADVLDYLDGKIMAGFDPRRDCSGCVFTGNVNLLDNWKRTGKGAFIDRPLNHEEFV
jgi:organic radical activating enzyme